MSYTILPSNEQPMLRMRTQPNDANARGDIFGGWLMSQIDVAGAIAAHKATKGDVVTVAVNNLTFLKPLYIYDIVSFYAKAGKIGKTSLVVTVEVFAERRSKCDPNFDYIKISDAELVYVAVSEPGVKRIIPK